MSNLLLKAEPARADCPGLCPVSCISKNGISVTFLNIVPVFKHTQKRFFTFKWNFLCFSLWPLSLFSFCQVFTHAGKLCLNLLFSWLSNLNSLSLSLSYKRPNLLIIVGLAPVCLCLSSTGDSRTGHSIPDVASAGSSRSRGSRPQACWKCCVLLQPRKLLTFFPERAHCWLTVSLVFIRISGLFLLTE